MAALSPLAVLARGFAMVAQGDGTIVRDAAQISPGDHLQIRLAKGSLGVIVEDTAPARPAGRMK
jgi:exodeoxyribonuclease VII large subunit